MTTHPENFHNCYQTALRILSRRDHSIFEIKQKLHAKGYATAAIDAAVAQCTRLAYLNDEKAAGQFVRTFKRQGFGPFRISQKLKAKGIADNLIAAALGEHFDREEQMRTCRQVLTKKIRSAHANLADPRHKNKLRRFLLNRGFSPDTIHQALNDSISEAILSANNAEDPL